MPLILRGLLAGAHFVNVGFKDVVIFRVYLLSSDSTRVLIFFSADLTSLLCFSTVHIVGS